MQAGGLAGRSRWLSHAVCGCARLRYGSMGRALPARGFVRLCLQVCCGWFVEAGLLRLVCCGWFVVAGLLWLVCCGWFGAVGLLRLVCCGWFVAAGLLLLVCCCWFVVVAAGLLQLVCCGWFVASGLLRLAGLLRLVCCGWFVAVGLLPRKGAVRALWANRAPGPVEYVAAPTLLLESTPRMLPVAWQPQRTGGVPWPASGLGHGAARASWDKGLGGPWQWGVKGGCCLTLYHIYPSVEVKLLKLLLMILPLKP